MTRLQPGCGKSWTKHLGNGYSRTWRPTGFGQQKGKLEDDLWSRHRNGRLWAIPQLFVVPGRKASVEGTWVSGACADVPVGPWGAIVGWPLGSLVEGHKPGSCFSSDITKDQGRNGSLCQALKIDHGLDVPAVSNYHKNFKCFPFLYFSYCKPINSSWTSTGP